MPVPLPYPAPDGVARAHTHVAKDGATAAARAASATASRKAKAGGGACWAHGGHLPAIALARLGSPACCVVPCLAAYHSSLPGMYLSISDW